MEHSAYRNTCDFTVPEISDDTQMPSFHGWTSLILHMYKTELKALFQTSSEQLFMEIKTERDETDIINSIPTS